MVNVSFTINFDFTELEDYVEQAQDFFHRISASKTKKISSDLLRRSIISGTQFKAGGTSLPQKYKISEQGLLRILTTKKSLVKELISKSTEIDAKEDILEISDPKSVEDILKTLTGSEFIKLVTSIPELEYIFDKSNKIEIVTFLQNNAVNISTLIINNKSLFNKFFVADTLGKVIRIFTTPKIQVLVSQILQKADNNFIKDNNKAIENDFRLLETKKRNFSKLKGVYNLITGFKVDTGVVRSEGTFTNRIKLSRTKVTSSAQFSALLRRTVIADSPVGPLRGPPLSSTILTFRTGRYANSIRASLKVKEKLIEFWYNPIYVRHESVSGAGFLRSPTKHITKHAKKLTKELYGKAFDVKRIRK